MESSNEQSPKQPDDHSDDSDIVEHDVKVCDICGDSGREDMLAICSRCSDGAEHTYCMRRMLRKVPPSTWMCEECKFADQGPSLLSAKRPAQIAEVAPPPKRQALEPDSGSTTVKMLSLSPDSSFKDRPRPPQHRPTIEDAAQSPVPPHSNKGSLFKSKSFNAPNSKPKVQLVDKIVPLKQKGGGKEHASMDVKERSKFIQKSMSFKSANSGPSNVNDLKPKMFSPRGSPTLDSKGSRSMKERSAFDRKNLSKLDRPLISSTSSSTGSTPKSGESSLLAFSSNSRDLKVQTEGKSSSSKATRRPLELPITSVGVLSATEQKAKEDASFTADKPSNSVEGTILNGLLSQEALFQSSEKTKETASMRSRSTVMPSSRSTFCQKCKEIGHSAEFCGTGSSEASVMDTCTRSSREEETRGVSNLKEAIHAALLRKPEIQRKKRTVDQTDEISTSSTDLSSEIACHDQAVVSNNSKIVISSEGTHEVQQANTTAQHTVSTTDAKSSVMKPMVKDFTSHGLAVSTQLVKMLAIPEYEYIWRGCFEVNRNGSVLELCGGIQAHLSTCVSPRVPEVARMLPQKLSFNEVSRLSAWPTQFYECGAKEDNIALYFFAKDLESYERHYKSLLDGMIKNDLALKGNFEGVELLIFPSNQLPENSQRWNMLFFLWGVFRARRVHNSDSSTKSNGTNDRVLQVGKKAPNDVTAMSENLCSPRFKDAESSRCDQISGDCNDQKVSEGLKVTSRLRDTCRNDSKHTSDGKARSTSPAMRETSPSDGGAMICEIVDRRQLYCEGSVDGKICSSSMEEVRMSGVISEKKVVDERELKGMDESCCIDLSDDVISRKLSWHDRLVDGGDVGKNRKSDDCFSGDEKVCIEECEEKVIPEDLGSSISSTKRERERCLFPVDEREQGSNNKSVDWEGISLSEERGVGFPNLELALGGDTKPMPMQQRMVPPFLVDKNDITEDGGDEDDDEDGKEEVEEVREGEVSASLSLSLSFSMTGKQQQSQAQAQAHDKGAAERQGVNTSLLLFGGFRDK